MGWHVILLKMAYPLKGTESVEISKKNVRDSLNLLTGQFQSCSLIVLTLRSSLAECARCGGWVHARCEGADAEKYQILSYLPDSVEYVCK